MISAILDTNVLVQALLGARTAASSRVLDACYDRRFRPVFSDETLDELINVLAVPHIRTRHGLTDDQILEFAASLLTHGDRHSARSVSLPASLTRDVTDTKFLALAAASHAGVLVTNDRRHLLPLKRFRRTQIMTPAQFLKQLA